MRPHTAGMRTYWYHDGHFVLLFRTPQAPPPGRYLGSLDLTRAELELVERMVEAERTPALMSPLRPSLLPS